MKKINKIVEVLGRLTIMKNDITTDLIDIKRIIRKYFEKHHANKLENLNEKEKFFERQFIKTDSSRRRKFEEP